jgi:hypothetical protein
MKSLDTQDNNANYASIKDENRYTVERSVATEVQSGILAGKQKIKFKIL